MTHDPIHDHLLHLYDAPPELLDAYLKDLGQPATAQETADWLRLSRAADESAARLAVPIKPEAL